MAAVQSHPLCGCWFTSRPRGTSRREALAPRPSPCLSGATRCAVAKHGNPAPPVRGPPRENAPGFILHPDRFFQRFGASGQLHRGFLDAQQTGFGHLNCQLYCRRLIPIVRSSFWALTYSLHHCQNFGDYRRLKQHGDSLRKGVLVPFAAFQKSIF
jgi:hypothetical protein